MKTKSAKTTSQMTGDEPPRIKNFRGELIKAIPRFPNDRASVLHMRQKHLTDLLIDYINWRSRYVGQRPRAVSVEPAVQSDPRWAAHAVGIAAFLDKVRRGDDLTPHLSMSDIRKGTRLPRAPRARRQRIDGRTKISS